MPDPSPAPGAPGKTKKATPAWARKGNVVLLIAVLALAVFGTTTQTWMTVTLDLNQAGGGQAPLDVQGSKAATAVTALALVALAGGLAAAIAGRVARWIITGIIVLASAGIVAAAGTVLADPLAASQGSIGAATGVTGSQAHAAITAFPALAVAAGCLLAVAGLLVVPASRYWAARTKYDARAVAGTAPASGPVDEIDSWDRLSRGDDPT